MLQVNKEEIVTLVTWNSKDQSHREIARMLGVTEGTVRNNYPVRDVQFNLLTILLACAALPSSKIYDEVHRVPSDRLELWV
jgi:transcription initiation factor TFIIIB Brf1 subunit/transcription initiation factor TFIIB